MRVSDERLAELREKHLRDAARLSRHEVLAGPHRELAALLAELQEHREREAAGYDVYQPVYQMAAGSFGFGDDMECPTRELAEYHVHRDSPWEPVTEGDDDDQ